MESRCGESKEGDLTDPMIFPWLFDGRLFERDEAPSLSSFAKFYSDHISKSIGSMFAVIALSAEVCFSHVTIMSDIGFSTDIGTLEEELEACMALDVQTIAIAVTIAWIDDPRDVSVRSEMLRDSSYRKNFPAYKTVQMADLRLHANMMMIDRKEKIVERFEPNTVSPLSPDLYEMSGKIDAFVVERVLPILGDGYSYCPPSAFCPRGPQKDQFCAAWSLLYLHLRLINPHLSRREIVDRLSDVDWGYPILVDYLELLKNTLEALRSGSKHYTTGQIRRLEELSNKFKRRGFQSQLQTVLLFEDRYVEMLRHCTAAFDEIPEKALFWMKFLHSRAILDYGNDQRPYVLNEDIIL